MQRTRLTGYLAGRNNYAWPALVFIVLVTGAFISYGILQKKEDDDIRSRVIEQADKINALVVTQTSEKLLALKRMAQRWEAANGTPENLWRADAYNYIQQLNGLKAVEWIDSTYHLRWSEPLRGNEQAVGSTILLGREPEQALRDAEGKNSPTLTPPIDIGQNHEGFVAYLPLAKEGKFDGFLAGIFSIEDFFGSITTKEIDDRYNLSMSYQGKDYFNSSPVAAAPDASVQRSVRIYDREWFLRVSTKEEFLRSQHTVLPLVNLLARVLMAALASIVVWFALTSRQKSAELEKINQAISESSQKLRESELRNQQLVDGVRDYAIYGLDPEGRVQSWNSGAAQIKRYTAEEIIGSNFSTFYTEDDQKAGTPQKALATARTTGTFKGEGWRVRKDGSRLWASVVITAIHDVDGKISGFAKVTRDITERHNAGLEAAKLLAIINDSPDYIGTSDLKGSLLYHNRGARQLVGLKPGDDFSKLSMADIHPKWAADLLLSEAMPAVLREGYWRGETAVLHRDGHEIPVSQLVTLVLDQEGVPTGFSTIIRDITERKKYERDLLQSENRYDLVVRGMNVGLWDWNVATGQMYWSNKLKEIFGITDPDFEAGLDYFSERLHPDEKGATLEALFDHLEQKGPYNVEYRLQRADGEYVWVNAAGQAIWDKDGVPVRMAGSVVDIGARVAAERALRESNSLNSAILAGARHMVIATDTNGVIKVFNQAAERELGYKAREIVGKVTPAIWHDPTEIVRRAVALSQELKVPVGPGFEVFIKKADLVGVDENEWTLIRKDGRRFPVSLTATALRNESQEITGYLGIIEDITERKEIERLKKEFVAVVVHELRTPVTSIMGSLALVTSMKSGGLPEKTRRLIDIAYQNSQRLTVLIGDMLDIEKIASGQMKFDIAEEALAPLIQQSVEANRPYADKLGVSFTSLPVDISLKANVDSGRVLQVLANLLSNAAKFSKKGGNVEIVSVRVGNNVRVQVIDHGDGIPDEFLPHIFGRFTQANNTRNNGSSHAVKGSGLGLNISKQIIEQMSGHIGFDTKIGKGTTFWFELPLAA